ncbi:cupin domain-containing protein [Paraburkholderia aromaticivorans]|uniref:cupin domain-containing protein n=1 Tax=Paraburkholderia aromaticivorans TaxID=2026199 RepID=UPI0014561097|nr:cupin domain-containing protein [Paraburkholderia aromaticivorans]
MPDSHATKDELIRRLDLKPHPEGGFFSETYRSAQRVIRDKNDLAQTRSASTAIYYLLCDGAHSAWHRIKSDEVWHFYAGEPLNVHVLDETGAVVTHKLGSALMHTDAVFQAVVPAGLWFAAECADPATFALVGCTVAPGFEFSEFELADIDALKARHPQHAALIERLRPN